MADKRALFKGLFDGTTDELRFDGGSAIASLLENLAAPAEAAESSEEGSDDRPDSTVVALDDLGQGGAEGSADATATMVTIEDDGVPASSPSVVPVVARDGVAGLFGAVVVQRRADGGVVIEAPPEAARTLLALFDGMARLMAAVADPAGLAGPPETGKGPAARAAASAQIVRLVAGLGRAVTRAQARPGRQVGDRRRSCSEAGAYVKLSTLQRYCVAIGQMFPPRLGKRAA